MEIIRISKNKYLVVCLNPLAVGTKWFALSNRKIYSGQGTLITVGKKHKSINPHHQQKQQPTAPCMFKAGVIVSVSTLIVWTRTLHIQ